MPIVRFGATRRHPELERLICAALSDQRFATQLVEAPEVALELFGHGDQLSPIERALVVSIDSAIDIYDFAARLHAKVQQMH
jgi:hypothetical protein